MQVLEVKIQIVLINLYNLCFYDNPKHYFIKKVEFELVETIIKTISVEDECKSKQ